MWAPRPLIEVYAHPGALGLCTQVAKPLFWVYTDPQVWACALGAAGLLIRVCSHPGFQVWAPSPLIWLHANWASGVCWGCLSHIHSPGTEGIGVQESTAAGESSLISH